MFQQWNLLQSSVVCEIVEGDDDDMDGGGEVSSTYGDEPFVDYPEDEVEVPITFIKLLKKLSWCVFGV